jgi:hypothetical protein
MSKRKKKSTVHTLYHIKIKCYEFKNGKLKLEKPDSKGIPERNKK